jgi:hypothetical protein
VEPKGWRITCPIPPDSLIPSDLIDRWHRVVISTDIEAYNTHTFSLTGLLTGKSCRSGKTKGTWQYLAANVCSIRWPPLPVNQPRTPELDTFIMSLLVIFKRPSDQQSDAARQRRIDLSIHKQDVLGR